MAAPNGEVRLNVRSDGETVRPTLRWMAKLCERDRSGVSRHVRNVFRAGEEDHTMTRVGEELIKAATEALAFARDEADPEEYRVHIPDEINPRLIRSRLKMSQREFADAFAIELRTLQDWEQGRRVPSGAARTLLKIVFHEPEAASRAVSHGSVGAEGRASGVV